MTKERVCAECEGTGQDYEFKNGIEKVYVDDDCVLCEGVGVVTE